jgi:hypothetical protein
VGADLVNRETLDLLIKYSLLEFARSTRSEIGREFSGKWHDDTEHFIAGRVREHEDAMRLFENDAARLRLVDAVLKRLK